MLRNLLKKDIWMLRNPILKHKNLHIEWEVKNMVVKLSKGKNV